MDVSQHIEIKVLKGEPGEVVEAIEGIILEKCISIKGMESTFYNPQVILI